MKRAIATFVGFLTLAFACVIVRAYWAPPQHSSVERVSSRLLDGIRTQPVSSMPQRAAFVRDVADPLAEFDRVPQWARDAGADHLRSLGWRQTNRVGRVQDGMRPSAGRDGRVMLVQDGSIATGEGEMVVWDWNDDDVNTMEGEVYWYDYASGEEMLLYVQYGVEDEYDPVPLVGGAIWTSNEDFVGADSILEAALRYLLISRPMTNVVKAMYVKPRTTEYCCVSAEMLNSMQVDCFGTNTAMVTKESWLAAGVGAGLGAIIGSLRGAAGGPITSLAGAFVGAIEGAATGTLGVWIGNFIIAARDGTFQTCNRETQSRTFCQQAFPNARVMYYGFPESETPAFCWQRPEQ